MDERREAPYSIDVALPLMVFLHSSLYLACCVLIGFVVSMGYRTVHVYSQVIKCQSSLRILSPSYVDVAVTNL